MTASTISTCLWVDDRAEEEATFYCVLFDGAKITQIFRQGCTADAFGLSWQIIPLALPRQLQDDTSGRVMQAMLGMVKLVIATLEVTAER
jgi:predicted 3-demethylubiquinone-9 3-methyltransferase (glyoxalase superfamily)